MTFLNFFRHLFQEVQSSLYGIAVSIPDFSSSELATLSIVSKSIFRIPDTKFVQAEKTDKVWFKHDRGNRRSVRHKGNEAKMSVVLAHYPSFPRSCFCLGGFWRSHRFDLPDRQSLTAARILSLRPSQAGLIPRLSVLPISFSFGVYLQVPVDTCAYAFLAYYP
jgi:hypothetical protein